MKYVKIYENFLEDYRSKVDQLELEYKEKIDKSLISTLDKLYQLAVKNDDDIKLENDSNIFIDRKYLERSDSVVSIYSKSYNNDWYVFEKNTSNEWWIVGTSDNSDKNLEDESIYKKTYYIENLMKNFSSILNKDMFLQINK